MDTPEQEDMHGDRHYNAIISRRQERTLQPLGLGEAICYTDAAWIGQDKAAGLGWHMEDITGRTIMEGNKKMDFTKSPLVAETIAIREALFLAKSLQIQQIQIASDAQAVIAALRSGKYPLEIQMICRDILNMSKEFQSITFTAIPRECNRIADSLAKTAIRSMTTGSNTCVTNL